MKIELLSFEGCPNTERARQVLTEVLTEQKLEAVIDEINVATDEEAEQHRFLGSPSIRVEGLDVERGARALEDYGMRCRLYRYQGVAQGYPPKEMIRAAIRDNQERKSLRAAQ